MINKEEILKVFEELYGVEKTAHDYYEELLRMDLSPKEIKTIQEIHDDEERHMLIVREIIELIKEKL